MKRIEITFDELKKGDNVVRLSRTGQTPCVVSEVFTLSTGEKAFRTEGNDDPGVYYKKGKFIFAYRDINKENYMNLRDTTPKVTKTYDFTLDQIHELIAKELDEDMKSVSIRYITGYQDDVTKIQVVVNS